MTPATVAARAGTVPLILAAWLVAGLIALVGGLVFAELASSRPSSGGLYGYLRDAFHPAVAFSYGWTALLASQSGGIAAAAITFASSLSPSNGDRRWELSLGIAAIVVLSLLNGFGVREGANAQNALTLLKGAAIAALIATGLFVGGVTSHAGAPVVAAGPLGLAGLMAAALIPALYAYDGWQTAPFIDRELRDPARALARGMIWGIAGVAALYLLVVVAELRVLGPSALGATTTPASDVMDRAFGPVGRRFIAVGIALSTLGFVSNSILTSARLYYAMAKDRLFFSSIAWLHPKTRVPVVAIALQALVAIAILVAGRYDQILTYVLSIDFVYLGLGGAAVFVFRRRAGAERAPGFRTPGHPWSTAIFIAASVFIVAGACINAPLETGIGLALLAASLPAYALWRLRSAKIHRS